MARYSVPGFKGSQGMATFKPLVPGVYHLACTKCEVKEPNNPQPRDDWFFEFKVLDGPKQENGKMAKKFSQWLFIKKPEHPQYKEEQFSVDQLKSIADAMKLKFTGDNVNNESFEGQEVIAVMALRPNYRDPDKFENFVTEWKSVK